MKQKEKQTRKNEKAIICQNGNKKGEATNDKKKKKEKKSSWKRIVQR